MKKSESDSRTSGLNTEHSSSEVSSVSSQGQTTIPIAVRRFLNLKQGSELIYIPQDDGSVLIRPSTFSVFDLPNVLPKPRKRASLEEIEEAISRRRISKGGGLP